MNTTIQPSQSTNGDWDDERIEECEEYQAFVESMVPYCHCHERLRPCDGVLAGGLCDGQCDDPREADDYEYRVNPWGDDD